MTYQRTAVNSGLNTEHFLSVHKLKFPLVTFEAVPDDHYCFGVRYCGRKELLLFFFAGSVYLSPSCQGPNLTLTNRHMRVSDGKTALVRRGSSGRSE